MGLVFIIIGGMLFVIAFNDQIAPLENQLKQDVPGFLKWALAILAIGAIGIPQKTRPISQALLLLVVVVLVLKNGSQFLTALQSLSNQLGSVGSTSSASLPLSPTINPSTNTATPAQQPLTYWQQLQQNWSWVGNLF